MTKDILCSQTRNKSEHANPNQANLQGSTQRLCAVSQIGPSARSCDHQAMWFSALKTVKTWKITPKRLQLSRSNRPCTSFKWTLQTCPSSANRICTPIGLSAEGASHCNRQPKMNQRTFSKVSNCFLELVLSILHHKRLFTIETI